MQIEERGEVPVTRALNKHLKFLEKNTVIREIPKKQWAPYCCFVDVAGVKLREPLIKSHAVATEAFRDGMREARRGEWLTPFTSRATKQTTRKAPSLRVAAKCGVCVVALLGFVVLATTFVARLASIRILPATQSAEDLIRGSL